MRKILFACLFVAASMASARSAVAEVRARLKQAATLELAWVLETGRCETDLYKIGMEVSEGFQVTIRCVDEKESDVGKARYAVRVCNDQGLCRFADEEINITDAPREGAVFEPFVPIKGR